MSDPQDNADAFDKRYQDNRPPRKEARQLPLDPNAPQYETGDATSFENLRSGQEFPAVLPHSVSCEAGDYLIHVGRHLFQLAPSRYADAVALTKSNNGSVLVRKL